MNNNKLIEKLLSLTPIESLGKEYYDSFGKHLEYYDFLLLNRYTKGNFPSLSVINSEQFQKKSKALGQRFEEQYRNAGLNDHDFMKQDCSIEIEKLQRYIHIPKHHHTFVEMAYVLRGTCYHTIGSNTYTQTQGCLTFINAYEDHEQYASPDCLCLTLKIRTETFMNLQIPNLPYFTIPICFQCGNDTFMENALLTMYTQQESQGCYHDEIILHLYQAWLTYCMQNFRDTMTFLHSGTPTQGKYLEIINYMFENYQTITLRGLAQHFGYTESYLCRVFKNSTGESFSAIMRTFKLDRAKRLLQATNLKLNDICDEIGYSDSTQLIRDFKKQYGTTPAKFRKQFLQEQN